VNNVTKIITFSMIITFLIKFFWITLGCIATFIIIKYFIKFINNKYDMKQTLKWGRE